MGNVSSFNKSSQKSNILQLLINCAFEIFRVIHFLNAPPNILPPSITAGMPGNDAESSDEEYFDANFFFSHMVQHCQIVTVFALCSGIFAMSVSCRIQETLKNSFLQQDLNVWAK